MAGKEVVSLGQADANLVYLFYSSSVGALICFLLISLLLTHTLYHYHKIFHSKNKDKDGLQQNKQIYILFILLCIFTMTTGLIDAFIKSNFYTRITYEQFGKRLCYLSYYGRVIFLQCSQLTMYLLFVYRLQIIFKDTIYVYEKKVFIVLYLSLFLGSFIIISLLILGHYKTRFVIYYFKSKNNLYCKVSEETIKSIVNRATNVVYFLWQTVLNVICLYMFIKRLWSLKRGMIEQYVDEMTMKSSSITHSPASHSPNAQSPQMTEMSEIDSCGPSDIDFKDDSVMQRKRKATIDEIKKEKKKGDRNAKRIITLHKLIKRHTILVSVSIASGLVFVLLAMAVSPWVFMEEMWFVLINVVCIWLMFGCADKYWIWISKHCGHYCNKMTRK